MGAVDAADRTARTVVFEAPVTGERSLEALVADNLDLGRPDVHS